MEGDDERDTGRDGLTNPGWHLPVPLRQWDSGQNGRAVATLVLSQYHQEPAAGSEGYAEQGEADDTHRLSWEQVHQTNK